MSTLSRIALGRAHVLAAAMLQEIRREKIPASSVVSVGSARRFAPDVGDVSLLGVAAADQHEALLDGVSTLPLVTGVVSRMPHQLTVDTDRGRITLHVTVPDQAGAALVWHTGSRAHTAKLQVRALARGLRFDEARLERLSGRPCGAPTEAALYRRLGLAFVPPELREDAGEVEAAQERTLPSLVSIPHIRGDLHMHTRWSDGRHSIEAMALAARRLGYEYIAITDHSERSWASRKLRADEVARQRDEIEAVRASIDGLEILHGVEVDIMQDGSLDFPDTLLATFDIVLASLHDHGGHDVSRLMDRYLAAVRHPLVNVITHPANRSPALSAGYGLDFDRLFEAAARSGTAIEIDGAPGHLDLDGALARRAASSGAVLTIDSDSHRADALGRQMRFGVGTARRGWVEPRHVLNTRPSAAVRAFIGRKRNGRGGGGALD